MFKKIFIKTPLWLLGIFLVYSCVSYFWPRAIPGVVEWWNTPSKSESEGKKSNRGPYGEEPAKMRRLPAINIHETKLLTPGKWLEVSGVENGLYVGVDINADAPILIRRYGPDGKLIMTRLQKPNGDCFTYDENCRQIVKPQGGVNKDIKFEGITRFEIGCEQPGVTVQIHKTRDARVVYINP